MRLFGLDRLPTKPRRICTECCLIVAVGLCMYFMIVWLWHTLTGCRLLSNVIADPLTQNVHLCYSWLWMAGCVEPFINNSKSKSRFDCWVFTSIALYIYTVLQMLRGLFWFLWDIQRLDAPPCVWAALWCLAPGPTWHHASVNWPDWLSLSFDFSDCFYYSLTFNFLQLWWESGENEFKAHEERNSKAFYSVLKRELFFFFCWKLSD